jgi:branched-chain amino acid transport system substrate-binding protein
MGTDPIFRGSVPIFLLLFASLVHSQEPVRIGMVNVLTGQFADAGVQLDNGVKSALRRCGTVAGRRIDVIRRDTGGVAPEVARRLARDLVLRDRADILAGLVLTANALAVAEVSAQTKRLLVVMGAGGAGILAKSPYAIRTSASTPALMGAFGAWAAARGGAYTLVSDYGPAYEAESAFQRAYEAAGGTKLSVARGAPPASPNLVFLPGGDVPPKPPAPGMLLAFSYDAALGTAANAQFVKAFAAAHGRRPDAFSVAGYDGMHAICEALKKTGGSTDADALLAAATGLAWQSPRGPVSLDPASRELVQTVYVAEARRAGSEVVSVPVDRIEKVRP